MDKQIVWMGQTKKELRAMPEDVKGKEHFDGNSRGRLMTVRRKLRPGKSGRIDNMAFEVGSGNVFADLALASPDERLAKARLAAEINAIIERKGWTQHEAAARLKTHQPTISALRKGRLKSLTYDRLVGWLVMLGRVVEIRVKPAKAAAPHVVVAIAAS